MPILLTTTEPLPEIDEHEPVELFYPAGPGAQLSLRVDGMELEPFLRPGEPVWRWRWNPGAAVGEHRLLLVDGEEAYELVLRVQPRKLDRDQYALLIGDLRRVARDITLLLGGGSEGAELEQPSGARREPWDDFYSLFDERFEPFERAVQRIAQRPRSRLRSGTEERPLSQATEIDLARPVSRLEPAPAELAPELQAAFGGALPAQTAQRQSSTDFDTYEHRLLRRTVELLVRRARSLGALAAAEADRPGARGTEARRVAEACRAAEHQLHELRRLPLLAGVGELAAYRGPTPLLQREAPYREVLRMWLALRRTPQLAPESKALSLPIAELPRLYELWCTLCVGMDLLGLGRSGWALHEQHLLVDADDQPVLTVEPGLLAELTRGEWRLVLRYQPRYRPAAKRSTKPGSLDRHTRAPDIVVEAHGPGDALHMLVLDAKYRLDPDGRHVPQDALAEAYAYRASIGRAGQSVVDLALLLYPGDGQAERYPSGVGALPLLPGRPDTLAELLAEWCEGVVAGGL